MAMSFLKPKFLVIAGYEIEEKIGQGGASTVYKARCRQSGRPVIVKVIPLRKGLDADVLRRFEEEFLAASKLTHPNIIQVIDFSRDQANAYLVTEYVDGVTLGERIKHESRLPEDVAARIITQTAQALDFAHKAGLVHRNVKPDKILVREDGQAKLTD